VRRGRRTEGNEKDPDEARLCHRGIASPGQVNERLEATVDFEDVDLSLLSTFPTFTVEIVGLEIIGKGVFEGKQLASVRLLGAGMDLIRLVRDEQLLIESLTIDHPELHLLVNEDGEAIRG